MYRVLVCDDDEAIVRSVEIYLKAEGYETVCAYNGRQAVEKAETEEVHCIIMDVMMPVLDGINATLKISNTSNGFKPRTIKETGTFDRRIAIARNSPPNK